MQLTAFKLRLHAGHARLRLKDGSFADLEGAAMSHALEAATGLLALLQAHAGGRVRSVSVDYAHAILRATLEDGAGMVSVQRIDGARFEQEVVPLTDELATRLVACVYD